MRQIMVRDLEIGGGLPKICVPIFGSDIKEILENMEYTITKQPDLIEWRADWLKEDLEEERLLDILKLLRKAAGNIPLIYTFRTKQEGGKKQITDEQYFTLAETAAKSGYVDLIDIEAFFCENQTKTKVLLLKETGTKVILSKHDFFYTPNQEEIIFELNKMQEYQPDILKAAYMPKNLSDVTTLMLAVDKMNQIHAKVPVIAVSMAEIGTISRFSSELFGSAITFAGTLKGAAAPGQADIEETKVVIEIIHKMLSNRMGADNEPVV